MGIPGYSELVISDSNGTATRTQESMGQLQAGQLDWRKNWDGNMMECWTMARWEGRTFGVQCAGGSRCSRCSSVRIGCVQSVQSVQSRICSVHAIQSCCDLKQPQTWTGRAAAQQKNPSMDLAREVKSKTDSLENVFQVVSNSGLIFSVQNVYTWFEYP